MPLSSFEASLRCLRSSPFLGLVFLGENLAPLWAGDGGILMLERHRLRTWILDCSLLCTSGSSHYCWYELEKTGLGDPVKVVA
jgi:hypothetical protein